MATKRKVKTPKRDEVFVAVGHVDGELMLGLYASTKAEAIDNYGYDYAEDSIVAVVQITAPMRDPAVDPATITVNL
jgi:hypothetical protein